MALLLIKYHEIVWGFSMNIKIILKVSAGDIFEIFINSLLSDINKNSNTLIERNMLKPGFTYKKSVNDNKESQFTTIKLVSLIENKQYVAIVESEDCKTEIRYELESINTNITRVYFSQTSSPRKEYSILSIIAARILMKSTLKDLEKIIKNHNKKTIKESKSSA